MRTALTGMSRRQLLTRRLSPPVPPPADYLIRVHRRAMACRFEVTLAGEHADCVAAAREALDEVDAIEAQLTVFRENSAVVQINCVAASAPVAVDRDLIELLTLCRRLYQQTERAFDITSTPLSRCWGFLRREGALPTEDAIATARACVGMDNVLVDAAQQTVQLAREGVEINLGAIGKGWALDRIARGLRARAVPSALLSAGRSSVLAIGSADRGWPIDITSSRLPRAIARLHLHRGSLGTSGAGEQFFEHEGKRYGHVLDPRTGWPAESGLLSVSVITGSAAVSDALSTAFLVGGVELARRYCATHSDVMAILTPDVADPSPIFIGRYPGAEISGAR